MGRERSHIAVKRSGFTLIEILVVVAIIGLMAAILFPSLRAAREQARVTVCLTNLHDTGLALHEYSVQYDPYYPPVCYIGCTIYAYRPGADDNLFVLWLKKLCPDVKTFTCPSTTHSIRKPWKIDRVPVGGKFRYDVYCDPQSKSVHNDWEHHGQLLQEWFEEPYNGVSTVNGHGTSYEYMGWIDNNKIDEKGNYLMVDKEGKPPICTTIDWYPFTKPHKLKRVPGEPLTVRSLKFPGGTPIMKDADDGGTVVVGGQVMTTNAAGNVPEAWDNHGNKRANFLYGDGHVATKWWDFKKNEWTK